MSQLNFQGAAHIVKTGTGKEITGLKSKSQEAKRICKNWVSKGCSPPPPRCTVFLIALEDSLSNFSISDTDDARQCRTIHNELGLKSANQQLWSTIQIMSLTSSYTETLPLFLVLWTSLSFPSNFFFVFFYFFFHLLSVKCSFLRNSQVWRKCSKKRKFDKSWCWNWEWASLQMFWLSNVSPRRDGSCLNKAGILKH